MNESSVKVLSEQRVRLDAILQSMNMLPRSRGASLGVTALEKGRMYIGEMLFVLGKKYPYDKTKGATTAEGIQDAVDKVDTFTPIDTNEIVALNNLREEIQVELDLFVKEIFEVGLTGFGTNGNKEKFIMDCNISEAYRGLKETRMWLGVRLGEIRDNSKK